MDDDCILDMPRGPGPSGSDDRHFVDRARGASEWLLTGTSTSGARIAVRGCDLFEFRGDKVYRRDSYWKIVEGA